jgi:hypothetical protein
MTGPVVVAFVISRRDEGDDVPIPTLPFVRIFPWTNEVPVVVLFANVAFVVKPFVVVELPTIKLVKLTRVAMSDEKNPLVDVLFVEVRLPVVKLDVDALPSTVCPDTVRAVADALPRDEVPEVRVEKTPVVKVGLRVVAIVPVEERMIFDPAFRKEIGELKKEAHCVVEAVRGTENPAWVPIEKLWLEPLEMIFRSRPFAVVVENVCTDATSPLRDVRPPPAPASLPQENWPVVVE